MQTILITGSSGVTGRALGERLVADGYRIRPYDIAPHDGSMPSVILDPRRLANAARDCDGIVHLAAVSRVADGERDPYHCRKTNERGTTRVLRAAMNSPRKPWVLFTSSREVYGNAERLPVDEDHPLDPINTYASSKMGAEYQAMQARSRGLTTAIVRLTNVYGSPWDHPERVVPAFVRAVLDGQPLRIDGAGCTLDFVHIDDAVNGIRAAIDLLVHGERDLPVVQLVSGEGVTIGELARQVIDIVGRPASLDINTPGERQVPHFIGDPTRARELLDGSAHTPLDESIRRLAEEMKRGDEALHYETPMRRSAR